MGAGRILRICGERKRRPLQMVAALLPSLFLASHLTAQNAATPLLYVDGYAHAFGELRAIAVDDAGQIIVADAQARSVLVLGPDGALRAEMGGDGDGPAEFRSLSDVAATGGRIFALDDARRRVLSFSTSGALQRAWPWPHQAGTPARLEPAGPSLFGVGHEIRPAVLVEPGLRRAPQPFLRYVEIGDRGPTPIHPSRADSVRGPRAFQCSGERVLMGFPPFFPVGPLETFLPSGDLVTASIDDFTLRRVDAESGRVDTLVAESFQGVPLSDDGWRDATAKVRAAQREHGLAGCDIEAMRPDRLSAIRSLTGDGAGGLWVESPLDRGSRVRGYDEGGRPLGEVILPPRDSRAALAVRDGKVYAILVDELGVQSIGVFGAVRR